MTCSRFQDIAGLSYSQVSTEMDQKMLIRTSTLYGLFSILSVRPHPLSCRVSSVLVYSILYILTCLYTCTCIRVLVYVYSICVLVYVYLHTCTCIRVLVYVYLYTFTCIRVLDTCTRNVCTLYLYLHTCPLYLCSIVVQLGREPYFRSSFQASSTPKGCALSVY